MMTRIRAARLGSLLRYPSDEPRRRGARAAGVLTDLLSELPSLAAFLVRPPHAHAGPGRTKKAPLESDVQRGTKPMQGEFYRGIDHKSTERAAYDPVQSPRRQEA